MRIRVTTKANLFEERKRQHVERGYRIEDEQPMPVNGLCSFVVVDDSGERDATAECVAQALRGNPNMATSGETSMSFKNPIPCAVRFR